MSKKKITDAPLSFDLSIGDLMAGLLLIFILLLVLPQYSPVKLVSRASMPSPINMFDF